MKKEEYLEEIELIKEQNDVEFEIYPMAVEVIQPTLKELSKRYVFARRKTSRGQIYYGLSSFPDVAILDKKFKNIPKDTINEEDWLKLKGCLEVKSLGSELINADEIQKAVASGEDISNSLGQLIGEILWYKRVIYTNGIEWRFLYIREYTEELCKKIIEIANNRIKFEKKDLSKKYDWWKYLRNFKFEIIDELITKDCREDWDYFIENIELIKWE